MPNRPRNPVARSPLMRKGGVHQQSRSSERQQDRGFIERELDAWAEQEEVNSEISSTPSRE